MNESYVQVPEDVHVAHSEEVERDHDHDHRKEQEHPERLILGGLVLVVRQESLRLVGSLHDEAACV